MSYEPTQWKDGDLVTSAKLNKIEQGVASVGGGGGILIVTETGGTLDKTWKEIHDALANGMIVVSPSSNELGAYQGIICEASVDEETYGIYILNNASLSFTTDSENGYPTRGVPK